MQSYSLVSHVRYVRVAQAISCVCNFRAVSRVFWSLLVMANTNEQTLSTEAEEALLNDDHDPKEKTPTTAHQDPMFSMLQNVNKTLGAMADSILNSTWTSRSSGFIPVTQTINSTLNGEENTVPKTKWVLLMVQMKMEMTRTRNFRPFVALKPTKLPKINRVLDSSKATAAMTHCYRRSQKIFSMQTNQVWLLRNNWLSLLTTCGLRNCQTRN